MFSVLFVFRGISIALGYIKRKKSGLALVNQRLSVAFSPNFAA